MSVTSTITGDNPTFLNGDGAVDLFDVPTLTTSGGKVRQIVFTISGVTDSYFGTEKIVYGSDTITFGAASPSTFGGMTVQVQNPSPGVYKVTLSSTNGISQASAQSLIEGMSYNNTASSPYIVTTDRTITLNSITGNGDQSATAIGTTSTIHVHDHNSSPTVTAVNYKDGDADTAHNAITFSEGGSATSSVFSSASVDTGETNQTVKQLVLTVSGLKDGSAETLVINGHSLTLQTTASSANPASMDFGAGINTVGYYISVTSGVATVTFVPKTGTGANTLTSAEAEALINSIAYQNTNAHPGTGDRTITLTSITDTGAGTNQSSPNIASTVHINHAPTDISLSASSVNENAQGATIGTLTTTDPDSGDTATYTVVGDSRFTIINGNQLALGTNTSFDHETTPTVDVTVKVTDKGGLTYQETLHVTVNDVNENPTAISLDNATVDENVAGATIGKLTGADPDAADQGQLTFTVDNNNFTVDADGNLKLKSGVSLDHEALTDGKITVNVTAHDTGTPSLTYTKSFDITVNDVNENPTAISLDNATVDENVAGATIGKLTGADPDAADQGQLTFTVDNNNFTVDADGNLKLKSGVSLDHEALTDGKITVNVTAHDTGTPSLTYTKSFDITVNDVNENPTAISLDNATVDENVAGATIGKLTGADPDAADQGQLTFTVDNNNFTVDADGNLKLKSGVSLDHEALTDGKITVNVTAHDTGTPSLTYTKSFDITVNDVNENPTAISLDNATVDENVAGATIGKLTGADPDAADQGQLTFTVDNNNFTVDADGNLTLKSGVSLDHEALTDGKITVNVTAHDTGTPSLTYTKSFDITVNDVNENPTAISLDNATVDENVAGATIGKLTGADPDAADQGQLTFTVDNNNFTVDADGNLKLKSGVSLDHEALTDGKITVNVTAHDTGTPSLTYTKSFDITVNDVNENPTAISLDNATVDENVAGATIGKLTGADPDAADQGQLTFTVDNNNFTVDADGNLKLKSGVSLDHEALTDGKITVNVTAHDTGTPSLTYTKSFDITVNDVNENPTAISLDNATVDENVAGATIGKLTGADPDAADQGQLTFTVDNNNFTVDADGNLKLKSGVSLDHEALTDGKITVNVTAHDTGTPSLTYTKSFDITVNDVNENPTAISLDNATVDENVAGATIGKLTGADPDAADQGQLTFTVDNNNFTVDADGNLTLKSGVSLDHEALTDGKITVNVTAHDTGTPSLTYTKSFDITVNDVNENPTAISLDNATVDENVAGATIGKLTGADPDAADQGQLTFTVDNNNFTVDADGNLTLKSGVSLDHEALTDGKITVNVTAHDTGTPSLTYTKSFDITVNDVNDAPTAAVTDGTADEVTYTEDGPAVLVFSNAEENSGGVTELGNNNSDQLTFAAEVISEPAPGVTIDTVENGQTLTGMILTVTGVHDNQEYLNILGHDFKLVADSGTIPYNGNQTITWSVVMSGEGDQTATLTVSGTEGLSADDAAALINSITYRTDSDNPGNGDRVITLTSLTDVTPGEDDAATNGDVGISATIHVVPTNDDPTGDVTIDGTATQNQTLTADTSDLDDADGLGILHYQWQQVDADGNFIKNVGTNSASYKLGSGDVGHAVQVVISYTDGAGNEESVTSDASGTVIAAAGGGTGGGDPTPTNHAPTAGTDQSFTGTEDVPISGAVIGLDADGDALTYTVATGGNPAHGALSLNANGTFTYTPTGTYNGTDSFTVSISDGKAPAVTKTITLSVAPVNDAPSAGTAQSFTGSEDGTITNKVTGSDVDGDALTYSIATGNGPAHGTLAMGTDGTFTYTPVTDYNGADSFIVTISDGKLTTTKTIGLTVDPLNDTPTTAHAMVNQSVTSGTELTYNVAAGDFSDVDTGDTLTYTATYDGGALPAWLDFSVGADGSFSFTGKPVAGDAGNHTVVVTAHDAAGATVSDDFAIAITAQGNVRDVSLSHASIKENSAGGTVIGDIQVPDVDITTYSLTHNPRDKFAIVDGQLVLADGAHLDFETRRHYKVTVAAIDSDGTEHDGTFRINVKDVMETIKGTADGETLRGGYGADRIKALGGDDILRGNHSDDLLIGGKGDDHLTGNGGADRFVFAKNAGSDVITDFHHGQGDTIDLRHADGIDSFQDLKNHHLEDTDAGLMITTDDGSTLLLKDVHSLHQADVLI